MNLGKTLFAQLMENVPWTSFTRIVARYGGDSRVRSLSCTEQFRAIAFAQLTYRKNLRDIETSLLANQAKMYGMGFRSPVRRSTLADANEGRDWHIWDNAPSESWFGSFKNERVYGERFETRDEMIEMAFEYIEVFYNRKRLHATLGYKSPMQFLSDWFTALQGGILVA